MSLLTLQISSRSSTHRDNSLRNHWRGPQPLTCLTIAHRGRGMYSLSLCGQVPHGLSHLAVSETRIRAETAPRRNGRFLVFSRHRMLDHEAAWTCLRHFGEVESPMVAVVLKLPGGVDPSMRPRIMDLIYQVAEGRTLWQTAMVNYAGGPSGERPGFGVPSWLRFGDTFRYNFDDRDPFTLLMRRATLSERRQDIAEQMFLFDTYDVPSGYITPTACRHLFSDLRQVPPCGSLIQVDTVRRSTAIIQAVDEDDAGVVEEVEGEHLLL